MYGCMGVWVYWVRYVWEGRDKHNLWLWSGPTTLTFSLPTASLFQCVNASVKWTSKVTGSTKMLVTEARVNVDTEAFLTPVIADRSMREISWW